MRMARSWVVAVPPMALVISTKAEAADFDNCGYRLIEDNNTRRISSRGNALFETKSALGTFVRKETDESTAKTHTLAHGIG